MLLIIPKSKLDEKNPNWQGKNVGRYAVHIWVKRRKPKPQFCEDCGKEPPRDLANKDHKYDRDINKWLWLCRSCHMKYDYKKGLRKWERK